jgi:hypothetical protein
MYHTMHNIHHIIHINEALPLWRSPYWLVQENIHVPQWMHWKGNQENAPQA